LEGGREDDAEEDGLSGTTKHLDVNGESRVPLTKVKLCGLFFILEVVLQSQTWQTVDVRGLHSLSLTLV